MPPLLPLLDHRDLEIRLYAAQALHRVAGDAERARRRLRAIAEDRDEDERLRAAARGQWVDYR